ncbi:sugar ABC transporter permease [Rhizocola hellebori]|uniref:Sugar ABC transporter permease n=1 Tax=Rhizocola hellebori TaxID=1392758 RepID=A0A8J3QFT8_9ACTN|nr:carbohydrate ABC transporter permease [Rhizocola hellebori]GIH08738.1 sugar ABC transporter permease [Rhizocola hellebori]
MSSNDKQASPDPAKGLVANAFSHTFLIVWGLLVTVPLIWATIQSFKTDQEIIHSPLGLPAEWRLDAFGRAWTKGHIGEFFFNTLVVLTGGVTLTMLLGSMAAYVLARYPFRGNRVVYWIFVAGLTMPIYLGMMPLYLTVGKVGEVTGLESVIGRGTYGGLILVYVAYSMPFTIFFLHAFFRTLPTTIAEAASVDGAGHVRTFFQVMLPMAKPGMIGIGIFNVIGQWNQFILPTVLMKQGDPKVLTQGLLELAAEARYETDFARLFAGMTLAMLPILAVYLVFHRQVQSGLTGATTK